MEVFTLLKIFAQVLGVFPFKQKKKIFYISKLYLAVNVFVGFFLLLSISYLFMSILADENWESGSLAVARKSVLYLVDKLTIVIIFGRLITSLIAVITKFMWRREHMEILNLIFEFHREHRLDSILNTTVTSDYFFIAALCLPMVIEISSTVLDSAIIGKPRIYLASIVRFQIILDEIMFCVVCSALSKYQQAIKQMILSLAIAGENEERSKENTNVSETVDMGDLFRTQLQRVNVVEIEIKHSYGKSVSARAQKLEYFRKLNLKIFKIYSNYSALHQYQLFLTTTIATIEITNLLFALFAILTQNLNFVSAYATRQLIKILIHLASNLSRMFMMCYYNDKAFNEGIAIKYIVQEIRRTSNDKDIIKVSKIFIEQLHTREQFQICGVFAYNMTLPMTFMGYAMNYVVVLVQYLGLTM